MSDLQYIGARYVPKFYENSQDPTSPEWESGIGYEGFMVVTYLGDSYTSKKPVPATVGDPASNPEYWAKTGEFNAAILALQNNLNALNDRVSFMENKKIIFIGDSYNDAAHMDWVNKVVSILGLSSDDYYNGCIPGTGFLRRADTSAGNGFLEDCLKQFDNTILDKSEITDIILCGGSNDCLAAATGNINTAISTFLNYATTNYPKAKIGIGFIARFTKGDGVRTNTKYYDAMYYYHQAGRVHNCYYIEGIEDTMHNDSSQLLDHTHPDGACGSLFARGLCNYLVSGSVGSCYLNIQNESGISYRATMERGGCVLQIFTLPAPTLGATIGGYGKFTHLTYQLATLSHLYFNTPIYVPVVAYNNGKHLNGWLCFEEDKVMVGLENYTCDGSNGDVTVASDFAWQIGNYMVTETFKSYIIA